MTVTASLPVPVSTSRGRHSTRRCTWVRVRDADGRSGWGECEADGRHLRAACATALADLEARRCGCSLSAHLGGPLAGTLPVNAVLGCDAGADAAVAAAAAGFATLKLKVGAAPVAADVARVHAIRSAVGEAVELRLDANGAWSVAEAVAVMRGVADAGVRFVEQPVAAADLDSLRAVHRFGAVAVVADEAADSPEAVERIVTAGAAGGVMIKVARIGGPHAALAAARQARTAGLAVFVSSAWESAVGHAAGVHTAAALAPDGAAGFADVAHVPGLGQLPVAVGAVGYGGCAGSGVTPDVL